MISAGDFRNGVTLEIDGQVVQILEFQHVYTLDTSLREFLSRAEGTLYHTTVDDIF